MAELFDIGIFSVEDTDGSVGAGWKLNFYVTGTSTRQNTYPTEADADAGTNANANPVVADAAGRFPAIWLDTDASAYKAVLTNASDVVKATKDPATDGTARLLASRAPIQSLAAIVGNGTADDTTAFQAAVTAAAAARVPLHLTGGRRIKITSQISLPSNLTMTGDGSCTIELGANISALRASGTSNIRLSGFKIDGKRATYTTATNNGIYIDWVSVAGSKVFIRDVEITDIAGAGIIALASSGTASTDLSIINCRVTNTGAHGIIAQDYISHVLIDGNYINATGLGVADRPGITASRDGSNVIISNNIVIGSASALGSSVHGISIDFCSDATVTGNVLRAWKGYGIEVGVVNGAAFTGNSIEGCDVGIGLSGDQATSARNVDCTITGNTIRNCTSIGIYSFMTGADGTYLHQRITITGNNVYDISDGSASGIGYWLQYANDLVVDVVGVRDCFHSGVLLLDCTNHQLSARGVTRNNLVGGLKTATITSAGTTATVTCTAHGYSTSDLVSISGASPTEYNQAGAPITVTDANTFTYTVRSGLTTPAVGTIKAGKSRSASHGGVRVQWSLISAANRGFNRIGVVDAWGNGCRDFYDISENALTGLINGILYLPDVAAGPGYAANLTSGLSANVRDRMALFMQNSKLVAAYNNAGTLNYAVLDLDGSDTTWANSSTAP